MTIVIVLAKAPLPGRVKTRLTTLLTAEQAATIAAAALEDTFRAVLGSTRSSGTVAVFDGDPSPWVPPGLTALPQVDGGLDRRLPAAFGDVHALHRTAMVLIAMDTPQVTADMIDEAIEALAQRDVDAVFGPAHDGGYWLIGLRALRPDEASYDALFHGVPMSTGETGAAQRDRLLSCGWRVHDLGLLRDIDTIDDIVAVATTEPHLAVTREWRGIERTLAPATPGFTGMS
jgi:rSAM/selenodomain-associated transferase 1